MDIATITRSITEISDLAKASGAKVDGQIAKLMADFTEEKARNNTLILDLSQKLAVRSAGGGGALPNDGGLVNVGAMIAASDRWAAFCDGSARSIKIPVDLSLRQITKSILGNFGSTGVSPAFEFNVLPQLVGGGVRGFQPRRLAVLESLPFQSVSAASTATYRLQDYTDAAALQVHEGDLKAASVFNFDTVPQKHGTVATTVNISRQLIDDIPMLSQFLNSVMIYFVSKKFENLIVAGNGTTDEIAGLITQGTAYSATAQHGTDIVGESITSMQSLGFTPDLCILNAFDYFDMISARDLNHRYIGAGPFAPTPDTLWGVHVVPSAALNAGVGIVLDTNSVSVLDRQQASIFVGWTGTQFASNALTILAELRGSLAVYDVHGVNVLSIPSDSP
jgi:hypothetical protein